MMNPQIGYGGVIARFTGKGFVALGFIVGIYGLTEGQPALMKTGLSLLVAGILASAYGLYHWARNGDGSHPPAPGAPRRAPSRPTASDVDSGTDRQ